MSKDLVPSDAAVFDISPTTILPAIADRASSILLRAMRSRRTSEPGVHPIPPEFKRSCVKTQVMGQVSATTAKVRGSRHLAIRPRRTAALARTRRYDCHPSTLCARPCCPLRPLIRALRPTDSVRHADRSSLRSERMRRRLSDRLRFSQNAKGFQRLEVFMNSVTRLGGDVPPATLARITSRAGKPFPKCRQTVPESPNLSFLEDR
jgi:hypothetical protein